MGIGYTRGNQNCKAGDWRFPKHGFVSCGFFGDGLLKYFAKKWEGEYRFTLCDVCQSFPLLHGTLEYRPHFFVLF